MAYITHSLYAHQGWGIMCLDAFTQLGPVPGRPAIRSLPCFLCLSLAWFSWCYTSTMIVRKGTLWDMSVTGLHSAGGWDWDR